MPRFDLAILLASLALAAMNAAAAENADTVLFNGKVVTVDKDFSVREAIAIGHGRVLATGSSADMKKLADADARLVDLGGRTVIPGLTDGHIHGIRAALTFGTEVNWIGVPSLKDALAKIQAAARRRSRGPGSSLPAAGPKSNLARSGGRRRRRSRKPQPAIPSISSTSMTGPCSHRTRSSASTSRATPTSHPAASFRWTATSRPASSSRAASRLEKSSTSCRSRHLRNRSTVRRDSFAR